MHRSATYNLLCESSHASGRKHALLPAAAAAAIFRNEIEGPEGTQRHTMTRARHTSARLSPRAHQISDRERERKSRIAAILSIMLRTMRAANLRGTNSYEISPLFYNEEGDTYRYCKSRCEREVWLLYIMPKKRRRVETVISCRRRRMRRVSEVVLRRGAGEINESSIMMAGNVYKLRRGSESA